MAEKERIRHFDTLKGIAIILVVVHHVFGYNDTILDQMLESLRMPLFVLVSGIFLSFRRGFWVLIVKKFNRYILPLLLFSLLYATIHDIFLADINITYIKTRIYNYCINLSLSNANEPLWFLKMLFFLCIITYGIEKIMPFKSRILKLAIMIVVCTAFAYLVADFDPLHHETRLSVIIFNSKVPSAIFMLPIYYFAYLYKDFFLKPPSKKLLLAAAPIALVIWCLSARGAAMYYTAVADFPYPLLLIAQFAAVYFCFAVAYSIGRVPVISYFGQYSLVILCTHSTVQLILNFIIKLNNEIVVFAIVMITAPILIYVFTRYLPHFTAQKELIKVNDNGKIRINFSD